MSIIWKPGDRAVFGYRPLSDLPWWVATWRDIDLSYIGCIGTVAAPSFIDVLKDLRVPFKFDDGRTADPLALCLFPIIEQPPRVQERERELVLK